VGFQCDPDESADLALAVSDLGALYLGGVSAATLAPTGRLRPVTAGAIGRATRLFATERRALAPPF
jgi:predicted acetyltransferase